MKVSDFIGMQVIDIEAKEVGKIEDLAVILKKCMVEQIFFSTGSTLNKKYYSVKEEDLAAIGDYVQLKLDGNDLENKIKVDKIDDLVAKEKRYKEIVGKIVLAPEEEDGLAVAVDISKEAHIQLIAAWEAVSDEHHAQLLLKALS